MTQFKHDDIIKVYWAMNDGFKVGRDPMGIQNSSVATYAVLLPGLTNLTSHIRYYSFYCWILDEYDIIEKNGHTKVHQYNFIRRAELAMAFIMKGAHENGVIGADFIFQQKYKVKSNAYDLANGGDYESVEKYWKFRSGAFGQYYLGSMINLNLVKTEDYRFYLRNRGRNLADAYRKSTDSSIRNHFIECVTSGVLPEETIERLLPMRLNRLKVNSAEWVELNNLLFVPQNEDSNMRPGTIYLLLKDLQNGISIDKFIENRFRKCADFVDCGAEFGWYYYYMCEVFHYCVESVFCLILSQIGNMHNPSINDFFDETKHAAINELKNTRDYKNLNEWKSDCNGSITKQWSDLKKSISECNYFDAFAKAIQLILRLSNEYEDKQNAIRTFELKNKLNQQRGILSNAVQSYVLCHKDKSVDSYLDHMIKQVMNEHTMVALNKMGNSNVDLRKFIIEDGCLTLIEQRYPTETNPRINSLHSFLRDMKYISNDDTLTDVATKYLDMYGKK